MTPNTTPATPGFRNLRDKYLALLLSDAQSQISAATAHQLSPSSVPPPTSIPAGATTATSQPHPAPIAPASSTWTPGRKFPFVSTPAPPSVVVPPTPVPQPAHSVGVTPGAWASPVTPMPTPTDADVRLAELTAGLVAAGDNESRQAEAIRRLTGQLQKSERRLRHLEAHNNYHDSQRKNTAASACTSSRHVKIQDPNQQKDRPRSSRPRSTPVSTMNNVHFDNHPVPTKLFTNSQTNTQSHAVSKRATGGDGRGEVQSRSQGQHESLSQSHSQPHSQSRSQSRRQRRSSDSAQFTRRNEIIDEDIVERTHNSDTSRCHDDNESSSAQHSPSARQMAMELSSLKQQQREWIEERQRTQEESKSLSKMLADIKRNTQRLVQERDDHLQVIARLQDRLSDFDKNNRIDNNEYHYQGGQFSSPERSSAIQTHQQQQAHQHEQHSHSDRRQRRMSPIVPSSNESSPVPVNQHSFGNIDDDTGRHVHTRQHSLDHHEDNETVTSSSSSSRTRRSSGSRSRRDGHSKLTTEVNSERNQHSDSNQNNRSHSRQHQRAVSVDADKTMTVTGSFDGDGEDARLSREAELEKELRVVVDENARLSERIPSLEAECAHLSNRLRLSEAAEQQEQRQQQQTQTSPTHSKTVEAMLTDFNKLVEEVDILEGVADAIRFGTSKACVNSGDSLTRIDFSAPTIETQALPKNSHSVVNREDPESLVDDVCKRISNIRSSLSLRYGRWLEAVAEQQDCATMTVYPRAEEQQKRPQGRTHSTASSRSKGSSSTSRPKSSKSHSSRSSTSSRHSRNSGASSRSKGRTTGKQITDTSNQIDDMTHRDNDDGGNDQDVTSPTMNTKVINQLLGED